MRRAKLVCNFNLIVWLTLKIFRLPHPRSNRPHLSQLANLVGRVAVVVVALVVVPVVPGTANLATSLILI